MDVSVVGATGPRRTKCLIASQELLGLVLV